MKTPRINILWLTSLALLFIVAPAARAQVVPQFAFGGAPGVYLDLKGNVRCREVDTNDHLSAMRVRIRALGDAGKNEKIAYISLPKILNQARDLRAAGKDIPDDIKFLGGLTSIRYVFVFPEDKQGFKYTFIVQPGADASVIAMGREL